MKAVVLNYCPFCGSDKTSIIDKWLRVDGYYQQRAAYAHCRTCKARGPLVKLEGVSDVRNERISEEGRAVLQARAAEAWNRDVYCGGKAPAASLPLFEKGGAS